MVDVEDFEEEEPLAPEVIDAARIIREHGLNTLLDSGQVEPEIALQGLALLHGTYHVEVTGEW